MDQIPLNTVVSQVREAMAAACARRGRPADAVRLLAAVKTVPPERIREAYAAGIRLFGENRVQERQEKSNLLAELNAEAGVEWHLLGGLQSNKAARALELFNLIETVDSFPLAQRLSRLAPRPLPLFLEVNIGREPQKHGVLPEAAADLAAAIQGLPNLHVRGLMAVPPQSLDPAASRPYFAALAELGERIRLALGHPAQGWELSMGMSHDYLVAIEEGSTLVRLGTVLFGERPA